MREDHAADPNGYAEQMQKERRFDGFVHYVSFISFFVYFE
jgi:hypothetical protein